MVGLVQNGDAAGPPRADGGGREGRLGDAGVGGKTVKDAGKCTVVKGTEGEKREATSVCRGGGTETLRDYFFIYVWATTAGCARTTPRRSQVASPRTSGKRNTCGSGGGARSGRRDPCKARAPTHTRPSFASRAPIRPSPVAQT